MVKNKSRISNGYAAVKQNIIELLLHYFYYLCLLLLRNLQ